mgnify:CR=1 FL=1
MASIGTKGLLGFALMIVGVLGFVPATGVETAAVFRWALVPAIVLLALGTLLVGTGSEDIPV